MIRDEISKPYWINDGSLPGLDFNRDLQEPGTNAHFPEGVVGIRADGDFWSVAALPWKYRTWELRDIIAELWPEYIDQASFEPDHGSVEQRIRFAEQYAEGEKHKANWMWKRLNELEKEVDRLRAGRLDLHERHPKRRKSVDNYFIRQYEHLLVAVAHDAIPRTDEKKGICSVCGLYTSDRVHMKKYIELHHKGYQPSVEHLAGMTNDETIGK